MVEIKAQKFTSASTSQNQVAAGFKKIPLQRFTANLDYGGGKFDAATDFLKNRCITNYVYDPFNRSAEHNKAVLEVANNGWVNSITCFNVLNVLDLNTLKSVVLRLYHLAMMNNCPVYIQVYECKGDGMGRQTMRDCWQRNEKLSAYIPRLESVGFSVDRLAGGILVCTTAGYNDE